MRILFFTTTLQTGGAEWRLAQIAHKMSEQEHDVHYVTLFPEGQYWHWLSKKGDVPLINLFKKKYNFFLFNGFQFIKAPFKLRKIIKNKNVQIIYSALYLSNFIAALSKRNIQNIKLVWEIVTSFSKLSWKQALSFYLCKLVLASVDLLISNSKSGLDFHEKQGFHVTKSNIIPSGIDINIFKPDKKAREKIRNEFNIKKENKVIGIVGRLVPVKDYPNFLKAAALLAKKRDDLTFVCVGGGSNQYKNELQKLVHTLDLNKKVIWTGERHDTPAIYNAFDIFVLSSHTEGLPNVVGEAMACGVPCVVTDVGDSAWIVGNTGVVVPPRNSQALSQGIVKVLEQNLGKNNIVRNRIRKEFSLQKFMISTEEVLTNLINDLDE